jgi:hypothetical protein
MEKQSNPFLDSVTPYLNTENLADRLAFSPLEDIDVQLLSLEEKLDLLDRMSEELFEPTSTSLDITTRIFRLIRRGYLNRNPTSRSVRRDTMLLANCAGKELASLPWGSTNAKGMTVIGITGLGKTHEVKRALQLIPQSIEHGPCPAAGWKKMTQVTWLFVAMSHDGSLGGFLLQILCSLDEAIGTEYSQDKGLKRLSNEKLAVMIGIIFRNHGLGVLVIDEIQARNFQGSGRGEFTTTFFLRLLNFGIPVVLMGNPLGMQALYAYSQDVRRIGSGGTIHMHPHGKNEFDWKDCLIPALIRQNLMPETPRVPDLEKLLFEYSGGIRDFACRVLIVAQRLALDLGNTFVTERHLHEAYLGSDFSDKERQIISGFVERDPIYLMEFEDIPWENYATRWGLGFDGDGFVKKEQLKAKKTDVVAETESPAQASAKPKPVPKQDQENVKRQRTRKVNETKKRQNIKQSLSPEDLRAEGLRNFLISGMDALVAGKPSSQGMQHDDA